MVKLNKTDEKVVAALKSPRQRIALQEFADKTGETSKKVFRSLRKLFENEIVSTQARKYKLIYFRTLKTIKAKLAAKGERTRSSKNRFLMEPSSGPCSRGLLLTRQPLYWAELSRHPNTPRTQFYIKHIKTYPNKSYYLDSALRNQIPKIRKHRRQPTQARLRIIFFNVPNRLLVGDLFGKSAEVLGI